MAALQKLKEQGWYLNEEGLKKISDDGTDIKEMVKRALDTDLRELGAGLPSDFMKTSKFDVPASGVILQINKIQNISAPKCNEESKTAPRLLQIDLTDGQNYYSALEMDHISVISVNTPPGTKVLLKGSIKIMQGMLVLGPQHISVSGGHVAVLFDKWEVSRTLSKYAKGVKQNTGPNGPPPWIPFGQKSQQQQNLSNDKSFKSLSAEKEKEESKENAEFNATRNEAIAEATKIKNKKVFGGGKHQLIDTNLKKIMDKGYSEEQAKTALKFSRNNLEKAMGSLKRRDDKSSGVAEQGRPGGKFKEDRRKGKIEVVEGAKPSAKVSLFDFLEDKIKIPAVTENVSSAPPPSSTSYHKMNTKPYSSAPVPAPNVYRRQEENSYNKKPYLGNKQDNTSQTHRSNLNKQVPSPPQPSSSSQQISLQNQQSNIDNRFKFENNISASFASRQKRDDEHTPPPPLQSSYGNKNYIGNKSHFNQPPSTNHPRHNQSNNNNSYGTDSKYNSRERNQNDVRNFNKPSQSTYNPAAGGYQTSQSKYVKGGLAGSEQSKPRNDESITKNPFNTSVSQTQNDRRPKSHPSAHLNQLVKATASLKISNVSNSPRQQHQSSTSYQSKQSQQVLPPPPHQPPQLKPSQSPHLPTNSQQSFEKIFPQMPNGFEYNPYKIMGFQNKETNEFALNVLKTQNFDNMPPPTHTVVQQTLVAAPAPTHQIQQQPQRQDAYVPIQMSQSFAARPPSQPKPQLQPIQNAHFITGATLQPFNWALKVHDPCFAKYWEDGRYYQAEITGMSDKTCVVQFVEYGNYEEVLLTDCVPINEANIQVINQFNGTFVHQNTHFQQQPQPVILTQQPPHQMNASQHHPQHHQQRFRGERQMYIPPAQRSSK